MSAIRIRKKVDSDTLQLPELKALIGKMVDITIEEAPRETGNVRWAEIDRLVEKNAQLYPGPDIGVDIIREMRDSRHREGDA
ncbi:MAG TPA: hypothetical protein VFE62_19585 [Gemmataceae bacterium]|nr:hypothetical protein [Gemmataceae bacterium]